jgi:hypothetical protein
MLIGTLTLALCACAPAQPAQPAQPLPRGNDGAAQVKAFPTAEGFGAQTVGGRGGRAIEVTNLNDSGPGSFRACAEGTGPRTCIFRVGGTIQLSQPVNINAGNSFLTIAGQTAPGEGIALGPWAINIANGAHDIIMRHVRLRQTFTGYPPDANNNCGNVFVYGNAPTRVTNVIIDHVSVAFACDDSIQGVGNISGVTFQWMLIGKPAHGPVDGYGGSKSFIGGTNNGAVVGGTNLSFHHNLMVHSEARNPLFSPIGVADWRYNIVYNWGACTGNVALGSTDNYVQSNLPLNINLVGNKYLAGPNSNTQECWLGELFSYAATKVYVQDNESPWCGGAACAAQEWALGWGDGVTGTRPPSEATYRAFTSHAAPVITATAREQLESVLASQVGATRPRRDALDAQLVREFQARAGGLGRQGAVAQAISGGLPPQDTDHDGMPDSWEQAQGLNRHNSADGPQTAANGYTNLENYLNELAGDTGAGGAEAGPTPTPRPAPKNLRAVSTLP